MRQRQARTLLQMVPPRQFLSVPNHLGGRVFLFFLRRWANLDRYAIVARGRKPKKGVPRADSYSPEVCHRSGIYFEDRWTAFISRAVDDRGRQWADHEISRLNKALVETLTELNNAKMELMSRRAS